MAVAHRCGHGLQIRAIVHERFFYISERSGSFDKIPTDDLNKIIDLIENKSLDILTNWKPSKLN